MAQRRHHYERAFEAWLRDRRVPYLATNEARKTLLLVRRHAPSAIGRVPSHPAEGRGSMLAAEGRGSMFAAEGRGSIKTFDLVIYGGGANLLVELKGRRLAGGFSAASAAGSLARGPPRPSLQSWVTVDDVQSLRRWELLFGDGFRSVLVFVYWCRVQPPDGLFGAVFEHAGRWYGTRAVVLGAYAAAMRVRSRRWRTVHLSARDFERLSVPITTLIDGSGPPAGSAVFGQQLGGEERFARPRG